MESLAGWQAPWLPVITRMVITFRNGQQKHGFGQIHGHPEEPRHDLLSTFGQFGQVKIEKFLMYACRDSGFCFAHLSFVQNT